MYPFSGEKRFLFSIFKENPAKKSVILLQQIEKSVLFLFGMYIYILLGGKQDAFRV